MQDGCERAEVWSPEVLPHWRALARLRTQLFPYVWAASLRSTSAPACRSCATSPSPTRTSPRPGAGAIAAAAAAARFEYLFGPDLLVAPVVDMGATGRDVWLPPGEWVDFWDAVTYDAATGSYDADPATGARGRPGGPRRRRRWAARPLFVRAGTCLPMLPADVDTLDDTAGFAHDAEVVTLAEGIGRTRQLPFGHLLTAPENGAKPRAEAGLRSGVTSGADDGIRTRDPNLGKVVLYQLSHVRVRQRR